MKVRTLLFGAGAGAKVYMTKNAHSRDFIGILDNDPRRAGDTFEGVIIAEASTVASFEYDEIVITTQWSATVKKQLESELSIDPSCIVIPQKAQLKEEISPFYNEKSRQLAREIVLGINTIAQKMRVPIVVDFGTLLGLVRDQDIILWDDDVDFAAPASSALAVEKVLSSFICKRRDIQWSLAKIQEQQFKTTSFELTFTDPTNRLTPFVTSVAMRENVDGHSIHLPSLGMWYSPEHHFEKNDILQWQGEEVSVPHGYLAYLDFQYGDWFTPKKNITFIDYANLGDVDFDKIKQAKCHITHPEVNRLGEPNDE